MKQASIIFLIIVAIIGGGIAGYLISGVSFEDQLVTGGDVDEYDCIPSAGYQWCEEKNECIRFWEQKCDEAHMDSIIQSLGDDLIENTSIEFLMFSETEFNWIVEGDILEISGLIVAFEDPPTDINQEIRDYLKSAGFVSDLSNMYDGTVVSGEGYQNGLIVCISEVGFMETDEIDLNGPVRVSLACGLLNSLDDSIIW